MNITWEPTNFRYENYDGVDYDNELYVKKNPEGGYILRWGKWVYFTILYYASMEDYENEQEDLDKETCIYPGLDDNVTPSQVNESNLLDLVWYQGGEGTVYTIHPRRYANVECNEDFECDWDTWDNGESCEWDRFVIKNGVPVRFSTS